MQTGGAFVSRRNQHANRPTVPKRASLFLAWTHKAKYSAYRVDAACDTPRQQILEGPLVADSDTLLATAVTTLCDGKSELKVQCLM